MTKGQWNQFIYIWLMAILDCLFTQFVCRTNRYDSKSIKDTDYEWHFWIVLMVNHKNTIKSQFCSFLIRLWEIYSWEMSWVNDEQETKLRQTFFFTFWWQSDSSFWLIWLFNMYKQNWKEAFTTNISLQCFVHTFVPFIKCYTKDTHSQQTCVWMWFSWT